MAELEDKPAGQRLDLAAGSQKDKRDVVESSKAAEGGQHVADGAAEAQPEELVPLTAEVSPDVSEAVGEFMEQAAQQNEAAAEEIPEERKKPGSYISFEHVYKSFGSF